jgi:hypothetical protein
MMFRSLLLWFLGVPALLLTGCAGRDHYFQRDARIAPAASGSPDSARVTIGRHYADHGRVYRWVYGDHYRALWATSVTLPVLRLAALPGQPKPTELGGGFQTTSITLQAPDGHKVVARTLDKDPYKTLPKFTRKTFLLRLVRDETSAANPFAPLVLPPLSQAAGVPYATPRFYYVPLTDSTFDPLTPKLRGKVVLVEEKFDGKDMAPATRVGGATDVVDSEDALRARFNSPDQHLDALAFARARLFDLWINDWDRHEGQWNWAEVSMGEQSHRYVPVPKDRDQAFFRFDDGFLPWLASRRWAVRKLRTMHAQYDDVPGLALNARFIDHRVLASVTAAQFDSLARDLQARLSDAIIAQALAAWPAPIRVAEGERTAAMLRTRRDALPAAARTFYESLAKEPLVVGTDQDERLVVTRLADGRVRVSVAAIADDDAPRLPPYYTRTFAPGETKRLRIYGLGGDDELVYLDSTVTAAARLPLDLYGGEGEDKLIVPGQQAHAVRLYDTKRGIVLPENHVKGLKVTLAKRGDVRIHAFDREGL